MAFRIHTESPEAYSPDVEIDHDGTVKAVRDIEKGDLIEVPIHLFEKIVRQTPKR